MTERLFAQPWLDVKRLNPNAPNIDLSLTFSLKFEQELDGRPLVHGPTISDVIADNEKLVRAVLAHVDLQPADTTVISQETEISPESAHLYTSKLRRKHARGRFLPRRWLVPGRPEHRGS
jgi:hypothetical protein